MGQTIKAETLRYIQLLQDKGRGHKIHKKLIRKW